MGRTPACRTCMGLGGPMSVGCIEALSAGSMVIPAEFRRAALLQASLRSTATATDTEQPAHRKPDGRGRSGCVLDLVGPAAVRSATTLDFAPAFATEARVGIGRRRLDRPGRERADVRLDPGPGRLGHQLAEIGPALDERQIASDRRRTVTLLRRDLGPRSAPDPPLRVVTLDRPLPLVADDVAG